MSRASKSKRKRRRQRRERKQAELEDRFEGSLVKCEGCGCAMTRVGGYMDTGLCGPCCTGEAAMLDEFGETW